MSAEFAQAIIEGYCGCRFTLETISNERVKAFSGYLFTAKRPIDTVESITHADSGEEIVDYVIFAGSGLIYSDAFEDDQDYIISYQAGYSEVPTDVQFVINALAEWLQRAVSGIKSERLGDYAYELANEHQALLQLPEAYRAVLDRYRKLPNANTH